MFASRLDPFAGTSTIDESESRHAPLVLFVGIDEASRRELISSLPPGVEALSAAEEEEAFTWLDSRQVAVMCLGGRLRGERARCFLNAAVERGSAAMTVNLVFDAGPDLAVFEELIHNDHLFYLTRRLTLGADLAAILNGAVERSLAGPSSAGEVGAEALERTERVLEVAARVAFQDHLAAAGELVVEALCGLLSADRAYCLIYDPRKDILWSGDLASPSARVESAAVGLVSFVVRTGRPVLVDRLDVDSRFEREADDPGGSGSGHFVALPLRSGSGSVLAVLAAVRGRDAPPFSLAEIETAVLLADQVASSFHRLLVRSRVAAALALAEATIAPGGATIFRQEALRVYSTPEGGGEPLRLSPRWLAWSHRLLVGVVALSALFLVFGRSRETASGPAVVRIEERYVLTSWAAGVVTSLEVEPGARVEAGQLVARLSDPAAGLEAQALRAPVAGRIAAVLAPAGEPVVPGEAVASLARDGLRGSIVTLLPAQHLRELRRGQTLLLQLEGDPRRPRRFTIDRVGSELVSPHDARRLLGRSAPGAARIDGPMVVVVADIADERFEVDGRTDALREEMRGTAEVQVGSEPLATALFPQLRGLLGGRG